MDILEKIEGLEGKFHEINLLLTDPAVIADQARYVRLNREYHDLERVLSSAGKYKQAVMQLASAKDVFFHESDPEMKEIERSMKIIEVLGQIIKNRSGSFKKTEIKELIFEVEKLGLRILTYFLNTLKSPEFKEWIFERISILEKERGNYLEKDKIEKIVEQNVEMMGFVIIIGLFFAITQ